MEEAKLEERRQEERKEEVKEFDEAESMN